MKRLAVLALAANGLFAADFVTGQAARAVVGQLYFTSQDATSTRPDPRRGRRRRASQRDARRHRFQPHVGPADQ